MTTTRPIADIIASPQKGDTVTVGDINLLVKELITYKGEKCLKVRFRGQNGMTKQWKRVRLDTWADQLRYLIRVDRVQSMKQKEEYGDDLTM